MSKNKSNDPVKRSLELIGNLNDQSNKLVNTAIKAGANALKNGANTASVVVKDFSGAADKEEKKKAIIDSAKNTIETYYAKRKEFLQVTYSNKPISEKNDQLSKLSDELRELKKGVDKIKTTVKSNYNSDFAEIEAFEREQQNSLDDTKKELIAKQQEEEKKRVQNEKIQEFEDIEFVSKIKSDSYQDKNRKIAERINKVIEDKQNQIDDINNAIKVKELNVEALKKAINKEKLELPVKEKSEKKLEQDTNLAVNSKDLKLAIKQKGKAMRRERVERISQAAKELIGGDLYKAAKTIFDSSKRNELRNEQIESIQKLGDEYYLKKIKNTITSPFKGGKKSRSK